MESFGHIARKLGAAHERAAVDERMLKKSARDHWSVLLEGKSNRSDRAVAFFSLVQKIIPGDPKLKYQTKNLPFDAQSYEFKDKPIGWGGENHVYMLEAKEAGKKSFVLKINHQDHGRMKALLKRARDIRQEYEMVKKWYSKIEGLVPPELTLILEGVTNGKPAIATVQEYFGKNIQDLFRNFSKEQLVQLLNNDAGLKNNLSDFLAITERQKEATGEMVDLLGENNLALVEADGQKKLILLDPHLISHPHRDKEATQKSQAQALAYLKTVLEISDKK